MTTPQPVATEPKRNWFFRHKILTGILALIVLVIVVTAVNSGSGDTSPSSPGASAPEATEPVVGLGTPVRDGKFEFVVTGAQPGVPSVGQEFLTETAQGEYVLVTMSVRNIGDQAQSFTTSAQKLLDGQGRQYSVADMATIVLDQGIAFEQINPGNSIEATIVFDVPVGTVPTQIELHDSLLSGGVTIGL
ncbi:DUF4352 domain-containing protein [Rhodococcus sp. BP-252]|uniref:DUF4352 domain-containing protein n=1 Tax=unclassified Rhodococcus (in: high G+C Gram-positive bacteria) TaxID=192944 RepID=UPI001C9B9242|nr:MULTISPECIES: DUF4352 domain-containing protein [unclassified Rhodococcus (in: high G+C Gram-positive bacteria)]MBY6414338.1 DUF4352 domain-containing protein [Rhodococcus sp. BP-320]MBY6419108.1 DUF4352 domain-containing protein [Rhodococcus sp. BP-321]MBY6423801.1 DUF4352 domain-containing protein [Rhodococcus sp. BP-324]MBY6429185.1 DUF4352 domain-containing protein [Rhodococcus sp. BP-323]MBY6434148.1 DUF4352 domain-containing protein [Rhodococcus sp. BP-322]